MNKFELNAEKKGKDKKPMYGNGIYPPVDDQHDDILQLAKNDRALSADILNIDKKATDLTNKLTNRLDAIEVWVDDENSQLQDKLKTYEETIDMRIDLLNTEVHKDYKGLMTDIRSLNKEYLLLKKSNKTLMIVLGIFILFQIIMLLF